MATKLTIGMAHYEDYHGVVFTLQALRLYHAEALRDCELLVVDNSPESSHGREVRGFLAQLDGHGNRGARYVAMPGEVGTTQPRNRVFAEAAGEAVLCLDCHVLLWPGALQRLLDYYAARPAGRDVLSGPLVYDWLRPDNMPTHFAPVWRAEMWGVWETDPRGLDLDAEPFEIPGMGLGAFSATKSAWDDVGGFNEHFRGFGGEELYIHEKFRQAGGRALCLPFLRWWHRFGRPEGIRYPLTRRNKVRNYVLGFQELGRPLDEIREHFVGGGLLSAAEFDAIAADPIGAYVPPQPTAPPTAHGYPDTLEGLFRLVRTRQRDLNEHADALRELAGRVERVVAFVKRREWEPILAAGKPKFLTVHQLERDQAFIEATHAAVKREPTRADLRVLTDYTTIAGGDSLVAEPQPCDLLILDTVMTGERLRAELARHGESARRFVLVRGTGAFGVRAEGADAPGLFPAIREWLADRSEWFVAAHVERQYGWTLLGRLPEDRPAEPVWPWPPGFGPGTELRAIFAGMGLTEKPGCSCVARAEQMDRWGVAGCRRERETIIGWLREDQDKWGVGDRLRAGVSGEAIWGVLTGRVNPLDPLPGVVDEAIRRAELKHGKAAAA